jgi:hypothetical protein
MRAATVGVCVAAVDVSSCSDEVTARALVTATGVLLFVSSNIATAICTVIVNKFESAC